MQDNQSWNKCKATVRVVLFTKKSFCQCKKKVEACPFNMYQSLYFNS